MLTKQQIASLTKEFGGKEKNTGATEVQVAILTKEIELLTKHFEENPKDVHSKRGFIAKIEKRKKLLTYLKNNNFESYQATIKKLGLRK